LPSIYLSRRLPLDPNEVLPRELSWRSFAKECAPTRSELISGSRGCEGLISLLSDPIDAALIDALPALRVICNYAVGYDNVDLDAARRRGITVCHTPGVLTEATADLAIALMLGLARRLPEADRYTREGRFSGWEPDLFLGRSLSGQSIGIIGLGRIGTATLERACAFGMKPLIMTRRPISQVKLARLDAEQVDLEELLERADVLSLHTPLTPETHHMIGARELALLGPKGLLINTARGALVDEVALVSALNSGAIAGAALDVYEAEPTLAPGLASCQNTLLLPHLGSATVSTRRQMARMVLEDAARVIRGERPLHPVPGF